MPSASRDDPRRQGARRGGMDGRAQDAARAAAHRGQGWTAPVFVISAAAEMSEMHPQTLRQYDRLGLVTPQRQGGRQRRYSRADVHALRTVQALSREGVSLEGIRRILELERQVEGLQDTVADLAQQVSRLHRATALARVFTVGAGGDVSTDYSGSRTGRQPGRGAAEESGASRTGTRTGAAPAPRALPAPLRALPAGGSRRSQQVLVWKPRSA